jgi:hypothetical protein
METTVDDSYCHCVMSLEFLNPGIEFNTRGLSKYQGVKNGEFWDFQYCHNPVPLDPADPRLEPFDCRTHPSSDVVPEPEEVNAGGAA